ncbi:hypothetical protein HHI36_010809 [Cryptolaemus montrouzieri]|uniref:Uncharacterized protein n=1 Tax=Cryptolaemus montrouzieri TaxID=559131 RepID=A0ABD2MJT3_9CUCU
MAEVTVLSDIQSKEKCTELENYWKSRLEKQEKEASDILKECQAISEYNIIQSELEKMNSSYSNVQNKLYRLIKELKEKETLKNEVNKLLNEKQTYETTILRCQETINILKEDLRIRS